MFQAENITECTIKNFPCRNEMLKKAGMKFPTPVKTGTTIAGIVFKVGVCSHCCLVVVFHRSALMTVSSLVPSLPTTSIRSLREDLRM